MTKYFITKFYMIILKVCLH